MHKYPKEMSEGMQQRVGIARAIAIKPRMLLLDEPFGRLDSLTRMDLQDVILHILNREHITTMLITHDVDEAIYMSDRICMMTNGPSATVGQILELPFERPRDRAEMLKHPHYYDFRISLIAFLEKHERVIKEDAERDALTIGFTNDPRTAEEHLDETSVETVGVEQALVS